MQSFRYFKFGPEVANAGMPCVFEKIMNKNAILYLLLLLVSVPSYAIDLLGFLKSNKRAPDGPGVYFYSNSNGKKVEQGVVIQGEGRPAGSVFFGSQNGNFAAGPAADIMAGHASGHKASPLTPQIQLKGPEKPKQIPLFKNRSLVGAISEIKGSPGVLIVARHVLAELTEGGIQKSFESLDLNYKSYSLFSFKRGGEALDVILFVKNTVLEKLFLTQNGTYSLRPSYLPLFSFNPEEGSEYQSFQLGQYARVDEQHLSKGLISRVALDHSVFFLKPSNEDFSTYASSGSLIYTKTQANEWKLAGILQCHQKKYTDINGLLVQESIRAVSLVSLTDSEITKEDDFSNITSTKVKMPNEFCIPINGRGGGGI